MTIGYTKSADRITIARDDLKRLLKLAAEGGELIVTAESQNGGLVSIDMLKKANELRLELSQWKELTK